MHVGMRLKRITIDNYKCVNHGAVNIESFRNYKSDLLCIYGQSGSGKTAIIDAIDILRLALSGDSLDEYSKYIQKNESARFEYNLELTLNVGDREEVYNLLYEFKIKSDDNNSVVFYDETLNAGGFLDGKKNQLQPIIDTSESGLGGNNTIPFGPKSKLSYFMAKSGDKSLLRFYKDNSKMSGKSFIFSDDYVAYRKQNLSFENEAANASSQYVLNEILNRMNQYGESCITILRSEDYRKGGDLKTEDLFYLKTSDKDIDSIIEVYNKLLEKLIPGVCIGISDGNVVSKKGELTIPLSCESDSIKKVLFIFSKLNKIVNDDDALFAADNFDDGLFNLLLGNLINAYHEVGSLQLILAMSNLFPLEFLENELLTKSVCFTTTSPENRYTKPYALNKTSNLRKIYLGYNEDYVSGRTGQEKEKRKTLKDGVVLYNGRDEKVIAEAIEQGIVKNNEGGDS